MSAQLAVPTEEQSLATTGTWEMKEIKPWHKQMASMLVQGIDRMTIATVLDCTPEYVSMLARQPKMRAYIAEFCEYSNMQLDAMFIKSVEAISDTLENGNHKEKMQAARLQLEATKRIGPRTNVDEKVIDTNARLVKLAERLLYLQGNIQQHPIIEGEVITHETSNEDGKENEGSIGEA